MSYKLAGVMWNDDGTMATGYAKGGDRMIGNKIKILRIQRDMTLRQLAEKTDLNVATLSHIENGKVKPHGKTLKAIADALGVKAEEIAD